MDLRLLHLSWDDVHAIIVRVADRISESGYSPEILVAVSRGGFDPARMLCDQLDVRRLASVQVESYGGIGERREPRVVAPLSADVSGFRVLLVDDVSDSGGSLRVAKAHVLGRGALEVRVATIHIKPWTTFMPDYWVERTEDWIVYPWETRESILDIAGKLRRSGEENVAQALVKMGFSERDVKRYLG